MAVRAEIESALVAAGVRYDLLVVGALGQARRAAEMADHYEAVVAGGGDGTINEVVNGLLAAAGQGPTMPLGIIPLGTGNDFSDMAGISRDIDQAIRLIAEGKTRQVDAGLVSYCTENHNGNRCPAWSSHFFNNNCAAAMEPLVTLETNRIAHVRGNTRYVLGVVRGFIKLRAWHMRICWDGGEYEGPTYLMSVANTPRTGGLFRVAPGALLDDGLFDLVIAPALPRWQVLALLPRLVKGTHVHNPKIITARTSQLTLHSRPATPVHADGEMISKCAADIHYQILPGQLTLIS